MSWAFFVAGTRSMVVSQWKVNSSSTTELMVEFYRSVETNQNPLNPTKAKRMRQAALNLMKNQHFGHPFYWASFRLVGSNEWTLNG